MRVPRHRDRESATFSMTPMIDVVFLLIIFYLATYQVKKNDRPPDIELPRSTQGLLAAGVLDTPRLEINVSADGTLRAGTHPLPLDEVPDLFAAAVARHGTQLDVVILADRRTPYRYVQPVMLACSRQGQRDVKLAVIAPSGEDP